MTARLNAVFVANVKARLAEIGMSRSDLARAIGIPPQRITHILNEYNGAQNPTLEMIERFGLALDIPAHQLLEPRRLAKSA